MNPLIVIALIGGLTFVLINLLRVKASYVFLALAAGNILTNFVSDGALDFMQYFIKNYSENSMAITNVLLLVLPALITMLLLRKSVSGPNAITNLLPAALTGVMAVYLVVPLLSPGTSSNIIASQQWSQLLQYQTVLVGTAVFIAMLQLWSGGRGLRGHKKGKRGR